MGKQISLFDMDLPPLKQTQKTYEKINFAKVPDNEFERTFKYENTPTIDEILKLLDNFTYKVGIHEILSDIFKCGAIAISNQFDKTQSKGREEQYKKTILKYDKKERQLIAEIFTKIYMLLQSSINNGFNDYLGELYMASQTSNNKAGQFFTPYSVSKACAEACIDEKTVNEYIEKDKIIKLNEPACGSAGMIIAAVDVLYNKYKFNYSRNLFVECSDIDQRCVHMTYLQLSLIGVPAIIYQRDTLTMKTWQRWETPALIIQWLRFRNILNKK